MFFFYPSWFCYFLFHIVQAHAMHLYSVFHWFVLQPNNIMYLRAVWWSNDQLSMTQSAYVIWHGSKVMWGHRGQKGIFLRKTHQVLRITQHGPVTYVCASPWSTKVIRWFSFLIWGHLGSRGQIQGLESNFFKNSHLPYVFSTFISYVHMEAHWPMLPGLIPIWSQRSFKVIPVLK